jgi:hypothetical protein
VSDVTSVAPPSVDAELKEQRRHPVVRVAGYLIAWPLILMTIVFEIMTMIALWNADYEPAIGGLVIAPLLFASAWGTWRFTKGTKPAEDPGDTFRWRVLATVWHDENQPPLVPATLTIEPTRLVFESESGTKIVQSNEVRKFRRRFHPLSWLVEVHTLNLSDGSAIHFTLNEAGEIESELARKTGLMITLPIEVATAARSAMAIPAYNRDQRKNGPARRTIAALTRTRFGRATSDLGDARRVALVFVLMPFGLAIATMMIYMLANASPNEALLQVLSGVIILAVIYAPLYIYFFRRLRLARRLLPASR